MLNSLFVDINYYYIDSVTLVKYLLWSYNMYEFNMVQRWLIVSKFQRTISKLTKRIEKKIQIRQLNRPCSNVA